VSWEIYERHGSFRYSGGLSAVTYTPSPKADYDPALLADSG
jgi:arylsulfatase